IPVTPFKVPPPQTAVPPTVTSRVLADFGTTEIVYLPIMGLAAVATLIVVAVGLRRGDRRLLGDGLLFVVTGVGLVVISVATSMFELRYAIPSIPLVTMGLALALRGMRPASPAPHGVASEHRPGSNRPAALPERSGDAGDLHPQGVGQPA